MERDGIHYRPDSADLRAISDTRRMSVRPGWVEPGDVCLDLGAHIGAFTIRALAAGAARVVAVEPMPSNLEMFRINVGDDPRVKLLAGAVTSGLIGQEQLYLAKESETDSHTMVKTRGRDSITVDTYNLAELCEQELPTFVKIDTEGAEYDMDIPGALPGSVQRLFVEWHFKRKWHRERAQQICQQLFDQDFQVAWESKWTPGAWWVEGMYTR